MNQLLPTWLPWSFRRDPEWAFDSTGWMRLPERPEAMRPVLMAQTYERCLPVIASPEPISCEGDRALQACLCRCQEAGISVQLLFMPESTEFRSWYPPITQMAVANYVDGLRRRGVSVIDARTWADDRDLPDGFHLDESGAICFTERLRPYLGFP
jgi:hypothetical protein